MNASKSFTGLLQAIPRATRRTNPRTRCAPLRQPLYRNLHNGTTRPAQPASVPAAEEAIPDVPQSSNPQLAFPCLDNVEERTQKLSKRSMAGPEPSYTAGAHEKFHSDEPFLLDWGGVLPGFDIAYETWGTLNADKSNAILLHTG
ncbi:hypothetical protein KC319_g17371, partial [Hortaea werneckii]